MVVVFYGQKMCHFGTTGPPHFKVMQEAFFLGLLDHFSLRKRGLGMYLVSDDMERRPPTIQKSTLNDKQNKNMYYITFFCYRCYLPYQ